MADGASTCGAATPYAIPLAMTSLEHRRGGAPPHPGSQRAGRSWRGMVSLVLLGILPALVATGRAEAGFRVFSTHGPGAGPGGPAIRALASLTFVHDGVPTPPTFTRTTLYAGTAGAGIFRSEVGGLAWEPVNAGLTGLDVRSLAVEPSALVLLFSLVASGHIKLRKIDGWQKIGAVLNQHTAVAA